jgi:glutamate dehydrogenase
VPTALADEIVIESRLLLDVAARWLLTNRPQPLAVPAEIERFAPLVGRLMPRLPSLLRGRDAGDARRRNAELAARGVPDGLAVRAAVLAHGSGLLDVIEVAALDEHTQERLPIEDVAGLYYALSSRVAQR